MTVRTRFAPSPTGRLHLGNVRAAVFNWLFARHHGGAFVLRIEDTDVERNVDGGEEGILEDLRWLGLDWDEGPDVGGPHAPYRQSERERRCIRRPWRRLVEAGRAYPCFCTEEELEADAEVGKEGREVQRYPGGAGHLGAGRAGARRPPHSTAPRRSASPSRTASKLSRSRMRSSALSPFPCNDIDDFVIRRSDGRVTYNFAVVADDVDMEITHVIRGVGHLSNTPKQALHLRRAGRSRAPCSRTCPRCSAPDGRKLSKREGAAGVAELRARGYPADAVAELPVPPGMVPPGGEGGAHPRRAGARRCPWTAWGAAIPRWIPTSSPGSPRSTWRPRALRAAGAGTSRPSSTAARFPEAAERLEAVVDALRTRLGTYGEINEQLPLLFPTRRRRGRRARRAGRRRRGPRAAARWWRAAGGAGCLGARGARAGGARGRKRRGCPWRRAFPPGAPGAHRTEKGPDLGKILAAIGRERSASAYKGRSWTERPV